MRLLIYELRPQVLEQEGLVGALQQRLDAVEGRAGVETRLLVDDKIDDLPQAIHIWLICSGRQAQRTIIFAIISGNGIVQKFTHRPNFRGH